MFKTSKRFHVVTLGCKVNQYDSAALKNQLLTLGWIEDPLCPDLVIVNTCAVTKEAEKTSFYQIRKASKKFLGAKILVTGCLSKKMKPQDSLIVAADKEKALSFLQEKLPPFAISSFEGRTRAFVKVQEGCNRFCSYCIVPFSRGRSKCRGVEEIEAEVKRLVQNGFKEIVLTGVNLGDFPDLAKLIEKLASIKELFRIRLSSLDPEDLQEDLMELLSFHPKVGKSIHLVLQSGSNRILEKMRRSYTRELFLEKVRALKDKNLRVTFTTDLIVGFPYEEEEDFQKSLDMVEEVGFLKVHIFPFSPREGTAAFSMKRVSQDVIKKRVALISQLAKKKAEEKKEEFLGKTLEVLIEGEGDFGHSLEYLPVFLEKKGVSNELISVKLKKNSKGFIGIYA